MIKKSFSTTTTEVTKQKMWKLIADVDNWKNWDHTVEHSQLLGEFKSGSRFILKPKGAPKVTINLLEVRPFAYFKDMTVFPLAKMYGEHIFEDTPAGLKLTVTMTMTGLLSKLWNAIVMKNIVSTLPEDLKKQVEAGRMVND